MQAERAAHAEVVGIDHLAINFCLFAFEADIGDPVLAATVGASGHVQLQVLIEAGETLVHLLDQPARKALRLSNGDLAEFGAAAGDRSTRERGTTHAESDRIELFGERFGVERREH